MNKDLKIFLVSGKARHGKDTVGEALKEDLKSRGYRVLVTHYADLVKYICKTFFDWDGNKDEKGRTILQYVGTEVVRSKAPTYWVDFITGILDLFGDNWDCVIIPDTRFPNEIFQIKELYSKTVHIQVVRPDFDNGLTEKQNNHASETALDDVAPDYVLYNDSELDHIPVGVARLVDNIEEKWKNETVCS